MEKEQLSHIEREFFKAITGLEYDFIHHKGSTLELSAKAASALCERHKAEAWKEACDAMLKINDDLMVVNGIHLHTPKNPYLTEQKETP